MMEKRIAPPYSGGKYDDVIEWLKWLEKALTAWRDGGSVVSAVLRLNEFSRHEHSITHDANTWNWNAARHEAKKQTMKWVPAGEAHFALIAAMERWNDLSAQEWSEHIEKVKACRQHLEKHNPPAENPIKY